MLIRRVELVELTGAGANQRAAADRVERDALAYQAAVPRS
jgi:hypothetical protein